MLRANQRGSSVVGTAAARSAQGRVLVVEDEPDVAELIRYNLTREGYEVVVASNGADALKTARELLPAVILLDIMVPQLNGWEVCRRLKQEADTSAIPVIMVTGRVEEGDKVLGFELGADDYVTKPFSPRELVARIRAVVRRGRQAESSGKKTRLTAGGPAGGAHAQGVRAAGGARGDAGSGLRPRRTARPRLGPGRVCRAPDGRRSRGPAARQVHCGEAPAAGRRDGSWRRLPLPGWETGSVTQS